MNSGQLVFRKSDATIKYIEFIVNSEINEKNEIDQHFIPNAIQYSLVNHTSLLNEYISHCRCNKNVFILDVITYHVCGSTGKQKYNIMKHFLENYYHAKNNTLLNVHLNCKKFE